LLDENSKNALDKEQNSGKRMKGKSQTQQQTNKEQTFDVFLTVHHCINLF
jgi:hypothetical protein